MANHHISGTCPARTGPAGFTRRNLIAALPAAGVASIAAPALALTEPESPMRALYREWKAARDEYTTAEFDYESPEERALYARLRAFERQAAGFTPKTLEDLAWMIVIADDLGELGTTKEQWGLGATAYAVVGLDPAVREELR